MASREERKQLWEEQLERDVEDLMEIPQFRRYVWQLLTDFRVFRQTYHQDSRQHALQEGMRMAGLRIMSDVSVSDDQYLVMQKEASERSKREAALQEEEDRS